MKTLILLALLGFLSFIAAQPSFPPVYTAYRVILGNDTRTTETIYNDSNQGRRLIQRITTTSGGNSVSTTVWQRLANNGNTRTFVVTNGVCARLAGANQPAFSDLTGVPSNLNQQGSFGQFRRYFNNNIGRNRVDEFIVAPTSTPRVVIPLYRDIRPTGFAGSNTCFSYFEDWNMISQSIPSNISLRRPQECRNQGGDADD